MGRKTKAETQVASTDAPASPVPATTAPSRVDGPEGEGGSIAVRIRDRAHEIYERRQALGLPGDADGDWFQAEAELGSRTKP